MGIIARPAKQGGFLTYQAKVLGGFTKIIDTEVDADLDTVYAAWNAGADTINIKDQAVTNAKIANAAGIGYSKLALTNSIVSTDLVNLAVVLGKIAVGASVNAQTLQSSEAALALGTSEAIILEGVLSSVRGAVLIVAAVVGGRFEGTGTTGGDNTLTANIREGGTPATVDGTIRRTMATTANPTDSAGATWSATMKLPGEVWGIYAVSPGASTRWKLTASYNPGASTSRFVRQYAYLFAMELA